jgi:hypothetical protein
VSYRQGFTAIISKTTPSSTESLYGNKPENPSEPIGTLQLLIASPITHACDKVQFRNILAYLVMLAEMYGRGVLQPDRIIEAFDLALDALRE